MDRRRLARLATSRIPLGAPGEVDYAVGPLPTPSDDLPADEVARFASVRLFVERGRASNKGHPRLLSDARRPPQNATQLENSP